MEKIVLIVSQDECGDLFTFSQVVPDFNVDTIKEVLDEAEIDYDSVNEIFNIEGSLESVGNCSDGSFANSI